MSATNAIVIDSMSLLVQAPANATLGAIEQELSGFELTLGVALEGERAGEMARMQIGAWLAQGAPGAPSAFADPADHLVAGLVATLPSGKRLEVRPVPRRAVGPDLTALFFGVKGAFGPIERAWLRVHRKDARHVTLLLPGVDLDPPMSEAESTLAAAISCELMKDSG